MSKITKPSENVKALINFTAAQKEKREDERNEKPYDSNNSSYIVLGEFREEINELRESLAESDEIIVKLSEALEESDDIIESLSDRLKDSDETIEDLSEKLKTANKNIDKLFALYNNDVMKKIKELQIGNSNLLKNYNEFKEEFDQVKEIVDCIDEKVIL